MPSGRSRRTSSVGSEFGLIRLLQAQAARPDRQVFKGIGDDTAILKTSSDEWTLITTDLLAEGVHFNPATSSYEDIGYRAAIANLSDIAAMGGTPDSCSWPLQFRRPARRNRFNDSIAA